MDFGFVLSPLKRRKTGLGGDVGGRVSERDGAIPFLEAAASAPAGHVRTLSCFHAAVSEGGDPVVLVEGPPPKKRASARRAQGRKMRLSTCGALGQGETGDI